MRFGFAYMLAAAAAAAAFASTAAASVSSGAHVFSARHGRYEGHSLVRIHQASTLPLADIFARYDVWSRSPQKNTIDVRMSPAQLAAFEKLHGGAVDYTVVNANIQDTVDRDMIKRTAGAQSLAGQLDFDSWHTRYHPFDEIKAFYEKLAAENPDVVKLIPSIGKTVEGRDIFALEITSPSKLAADGSAKKTAYHEFNIHAREWISGAVGQYFTEHLVKAYRSGDERVTRILDSTVVAITPMVNPDGYVYSWTTDRLWRKNRRDNGDGTSGVDMNRNFPVFWGPDGTSDDGDSEIYHGTHPASEPEVQAVVNYYNSLPNKVTALEVHTCSQLLLYPFSGKPEFPAQPDLDNYRAISYKMAETIAKLRNTKYVVANIYNDLYPSAGCAADFFYMPDNSTRTAYALAVELSPTMVDSAEQCFILDDAEIEPVGKEITPAFLDFIEFGSSNPLVNSR